MKIIDISWPIFPDMTAYKDRKTVDIIAAKIFDGDGVRESYLQLGAHSGTHVDAPAHFLRDGKTYDKLPLSLFIGKCSVLDLTYVDECIRQEDLERFSIEPECIVLCKTQNSYPPPDAPFNHQFVYVHATAAQYLADKKVKAVGIDYLGIERSQPRHDTHTILMHNAVGIVEGLRLGHVDAGNYMLWCLPLAYIKTEAVPARAVLIPL